MIRTFSILALAAATASCAADRAQDVVLLRWSPDTSVLNLELLRDNSDSLFSNDILLRPMNVRAAGNLRFVADLGANRVAVLDSDAKVIRWIGTPGHGPGELYGVSHLAVRGTHVFVGEALNGRVSEFTDDGRFVQAYSSPFAAGALAATSTSVVSISRSPTHYAAVLTTDGAPAPAFPRATDAALDRDNRWTALPGHDLIAADSTATWVLDQATAVVCEYPQHAARTCAVLPRDLLERLNAYRDDRVTRLEAATHLHVQAAPVVKDMIRVGHRLALLLPLPELPVVWIDMVSGVVTPALNSSRDLPPWARSARSFAWDRGGFLTVGDDGVGRFTITSHTPNH